MLPQSVEFSILINTDEQCKFNVSDVVLRRLAAVLLSNIRTDKAITALRSVPKSSFFVCVVACSRIIFILHLLRFGLRYTFLLVFIQLNTFFMQPKWEWKPTLIALIPFIIR